MRHPLHDYSHAAGYFVTTVTAKRIVLFGSIADGCFTASACGDLVESIWLAMPDSFPGLVLDAYQLMPDHFHALMIITHLPTSNNIAPIHFGLPQVMQQFKRRSALGINRLRDAPGTAVWQEGYHDRIIRSEIEFEKYRTYITTNPLRTYLKR